MFSIRNVRISEWAVLLLFAASVLWKGGKGLEMTWLLAGLAPILTIGYWLSRSARRNNRESELEMRRGLASTRPEIPFGLWAAVLLYIVFSVSSYIFSETKNYGIDDVIRASGLMLLFLWVARMQVDRSGMSLRKTFPLFATWSAAIACFIGIAVYLFQPVNRFVGTFFDYRFNTDYWPNAWAEFVLLAWPLALLVAWRQEKRNVRWFYLAILSLILSALFLSYSRGAVLAMIGQVAVMAVLFGTVIVRDIRYRRIFRSIVKLLLIKTIALIVGTALLFFAINELRANNYEVQSISEKVTFTAAEGKSSINERAQFWEQSWNLALQKPLTGWGPYSFRFVQPREMKHVLATSDHPHNVLLKLAMERGFPVAFLFIAVFGGVLGYAILSFFTARKATLFEHDAFTILSIGAIVGVLLHNMIDFNLQFTAIDIGCVVLLGLLVPSAVPSRDLAAQPSFTRWRMRKLLSRSDIAIAILLFAVAAWEGTFLATSSVGRHAMAAGDNERALAWFERSHLGLFSRDLYLSEAQLRLERGDVSEASDAIAHYQSLNQHDPRGWKMLGMLYMQTGDDARAVNALMEAYERGKYTDLGILRLLLEATRRTGRQEVILNRKFEFDRIFTAYADAIESNTHFIALSHNVDELMGVASLLSAMYPADANQYRSIAESAEAHATLERQSYSARQPGILW